MLEMGGGLSPPPTLVGLVVSPAPKSPKSLVPGLAWRAARTLDSDGRGSRWPCLFSPGGTGGGVAKVMDA